MPAKIENHLTLKGRSPAGKWTPSDSPRCAGETLGFFVRKIGVSKSFDVFQTSMCKKKKV